MVNFVLSFCRITGASKIFSRNFYLPLLKPLTPREAFRTFRITGKWLLGSKIQRYIPVLLNHKKERSKHLKNYGKLKHEEIEDFTYMTPILDPENESQKILLSILENKSSSGVFVYTIGDKKLNIVLQAQIEYAVRDGDIIDVLVSQKNDKIIIKLKDFKKVPMELDFFYDTKEPMFCGEGATTEADEKLHHYGKYTMSLAKIFEDKERQEEEWEIMLKKVIKRRKRHAVEKSKEYKALIKENLRKLDWDKFEEEAKKFVEEINEISPMQEKPIDMEVDNLERTLYVNEYFSCDGNIQLLPTMNEINDVIKSMSSAQLHDISFIRIDESEGSLETKISGVKIILSSGKELFICGQIVHSEDGDVFVPGQTIHTEHGLEFIPGFTVNIDGKPSLINGLIMAQNENEPMFLPTQSTITADGQLTFALTEEERPPPPTQEHIEIRKERRKKQLEQINVVFEENENISEESIQDEIPDKNEFVEDNKQEEEEESIIVFLNEKDLIEAETSDDSDSAVSEIDYEAIKFKQAQDRAELEELKKLLLEDGMGKLVSELEDKKLSLQQKLDELRKLKMESQRPLITYATEKDALEIASRITYDNEAINKIVDILLTIVRKTAGFKDKNSIHPENIIETHVILNDGGFVSEKYHRSSKNMRIFLKSSFVAANKVFKERPKDQIMALEKIGDIFIDVLQNNQTLMEELERLMNTSIERNEVFDIVLKYLTYDYRDSKVNILSNIMNSPKKSVDKITEGIEKLMLNDNKLLCEAFLKLIKLNEDILGDMLEYCRNHSRRIKIENDVIDLLEQSMISATATFINENFSEIFNFSEDEFNEFMNESIIFAEALGQNDISEEIREKKLSSINNEHNKAANFMKRMFLIRKLANKEYTMRKAIERLLRNPEQAKLDPRIRQLIRESGVLLSNGPGLRNSKAIPLQLFKSQNLLGLEDFIVQRINVEYPVLIIRNDFQAVIPKEALQGVQSGRMPYVLIDESGISNFKPLHTLAAMKGSKNAEHDSNNKYSKFNCDIDFNKESVVLGRTRTNFA